MTDQVLVPAGTLPDVLRAVAAALASVDMDVGVSRYSLWVSEPFDGEAAS